MLGAPIRFCVSVCVCAEALRVQSEASLSKHGRQSAQLEELIRSLEQSSDATAGQHHETKLQGA